MATTYNRSITTHFGGSDPNQIQLHNEIYGSVGPTLLGIEITGDSVDIRFDSALSGGEETTLNGLLSAHIADNSKPKIQFYSINPKKESIKTNSYSIVSRFKYTGSDIIGTIDYIDIISKKDSGITSYSVRVVDITNNLVIAEKTGMTNTTEDIQDLGTISNVPTDQAVFELQAKKIGGSGNTSVYIDAINIYYGN